MARKPSASAHKKVLNAALELVAEHGVEATSMDAIARKSGVSKATIYKHWVDKDALLLEMLAELHGLDRRPQFDSGNTRADMIAVLSYRPPEDAGMRERITLHFGAYSASNLSFGIAWRNMVMEPPRRELRHLLNLGIEKGELSPKLDFDLSLALLLGSILYWYIFLRKTSDNPKDLAVGIVDVFWNAFCVQKSFSRPLVRQTKPKAVPT